MNKAIELIDKKIAEHKQNLLHWSSGKILVTDIMSDIKEGKNEHAISAEIYAYARYYEALNCVCELSRIREALLGEC